MRTLFALLAAFFAGMWLTKRTNRQQELRRSIVIQVPPQPIDHRLIDEVMPEIQKDFDDFDTKSSLFDHYATLVRKAVNMPLTPKQLYQFGETIIAITSSLAYWDHEQELKLEEDL